MFKRLGKAFGNRKKRRDTSAPKRAPGEGIRQVAAAIPPEREPPATVRSAPPNKAAAANAPAPGTAVRRRTADPTPPSEAEPKGPSRETLIREALRIRREKAQDLQNLPPRDQERLNQLAKKMLMGDEPEAITGEKPSGGPGKNRRHTRH